LKRFAKLLVWAALVAMLHTLLFVSPWGQLLEHRSLDAWFNLRGPIPCPSDIVVIAMDEDSYDALGFQPTAAWPRGSHAELLRILATNGARRVVFDVLFSGPSPSGDQSLAEAMHLLPTIIGAEVIETVETASAERSYTNKVLQLPFAPFRASARSALVGLPQDRNHLRRFLVPKALATHEVTRELTSLAVAAAGVTNEPGPRDLLRFYGPARNIRTYSYYQAFQLEPPLPAETFRDKIVFVGLSLQTGVGPMQKDEYATSFGRMFGVEAHATAAANLLEGKWIHRASAAKEASALGFIAALLTLCLLSVRPGWGALVVLGFLAVWSGFAYLSFKSGLFLPGVGLALIVMPATYTGATLWNYFSVRVQQLRIERAFRFYLSPEMARDVARNPDALKLGGEEIECTALFTDIAGFTTTAEKMQPREVSEMLNSYFTEVMDSIFEKRGTVIQFLGDGVYALWGAPAKTSEHARLCCEAALKISAEIERFNQTGRFPPLNTRFGINTGLVLVGNLGSKRRFDFTGIGDTVNLASRVEGLNKYFGTTILLTETTRQQLPSTIASTKMGLIRAAGKTLPIELHTIFCEPLLGSSTQRWSEACARFIAREWTVADQLFSDVRSQDARLTKAADLYRSQIELHRMSPPSPEWNGEVIFSSK
jgi:adenylate cyclase